MAAGAAVALKRWLHRRQRPQRYAYLAELLANQRLSAAALRTQQESALQDIVAFARSNTRFYAEHYRDLPPGWRIDDLPVLTKADLRARLPELLAQGHDPATTPIGHTGGSTGTPLAFWYDEEKHERMRAGMIRSYMLSGWRPGQKILNFWGARQDTVKGGVFRSSVWDDLIAAETTLPAHEISAAKLAAWASVIRRYRPVLLQGYASILAALARHVRDEKISMPDSLLGVYSTAEVLTEAMRETMESAFGCQVFNQYGSREIPNIACECRHGSMHVFSDLVWLESRNGQLLVTSLTNRLMPMIRYENGDAGELLAGECACGLPFPRMQMGLCRHNDFIVTPDGRRLHPAFFNRLLYGHTGIAAYQWRQDAPGEVRLLLAGDTEKSAQPLRAASGLTASLLAGRQMEQQLSDALAREGLALAIETVPEIERTISGKHRFVISLL